MGMRFLDTARSRAKSGSWTGLFGDSETARRVVAAADAERRRIERDLHDGAQQRLMAIRLELGVLAEGLGDDQARLRGELDRLRGDVDEALDEIRELAHGLYPPLLASDGLYAALTAAARRTPIPVTIRRARLGRLPPAVESAAYFCCVEALQNVVKHAGPHARTSVCFELRGDALELRVSDDGRGFDRSRTSPGGGLTNLRDRLSAIGGYAEITSAPGRGTTVLGHIPLDEWQPTDSVGARTRVNGGARFRIGRRAQARG
jgi:signal transduction histidine kinase